MPRDPFSVSAWMTSNPRTTSPSELARQAYFLMRAEGYRHLPVVDDGKLVGIVTDRDLRRPDYSGAADGWNDDYRLSDDYTVRDLMTERVMTIGSKDPLERAIKKMSDAKVSALPVLDKNDDLIGIISTWDLMHALQTALNEKGDQMRR